MPTESIEPTAAGQGQDRNQPAQDSPVQEEFSFPLPDLDEELLSALLDERSLQARAEQVGVSPAVAEQFLSTVEGLLPDATDEQLRGVVGLLGLGEEAVQAALTAFQGRDGQDSQASPRPLRTVSERYLAFRDMFWYRQGLEEGRRPLRCWLCQVNLSSAGGERSLNIYSVRTYCGRCLEETPNLQEASDAASISQRTPVQPDSVSVFVNDGMLREFASDGMYAAALVGVFTGLYAGQVRFLPGSSGGPPTRTAVVPSELAEMILEETPEPEGM